jgi:hypothetical protein
MNGGIRQGGGEICSKKNTRNKLNLCHVLSLVCRCLLRLAGKQAILSETGFMFKEKSSLHLVGTGIQPGYSK